MKKKRPAWLASILALAALAVGAFLGIPMGQEAVPSDMSAIVEEMAEPVFEASQISDIREDEWYDQKEDVALYIHTFGRLPDNFITKSDAEKLGWDNRSVTLDEVAPGMSIGGSHFGNYEGALPDKKGRSWHECDIDASYGKRGVKRLVYSNDGLIYYTEDHYKTFERLY